jgi:hypothetical protein
VHERRFSNVVHRSAARYHVDRADHDLGAGADHDRGTIRAPHPGAGGRRER